MSWNKNGILEKVFLKIDTHLLFYIVCYVMMKKIMNIPFIYIITEHKNTPTP